MKQIKLRGTDTEFLNELLKDKKFDLLVGHDKFGNEIYEGDRVYSESGEVYTVQLQAVINYIPQNERLFDMILEAADDE